MVNLRPVIAAWLNASQRSHVGVGMTRSAGGGGGFCEVSSPKDWILHYVPFTFNKRYGDRMYMLPIDLQVIDSSDVVVQVLDARDPIGTRSPYIERYLRKEKQHKHLFFILNKCDLVPTWVTVSATTLTVPI